MAKLPTIGCRDAVKAFGKAGFEVAPKRGRGSHVYLIHIDDRRILCIPNHNPIKPGTLRRLIHDADLTVSQFVDLL